ncbi:MAG: radical SAM protein [Thermoplasmatota archaeon]
MAVRDPAMETSRPTSRGPASIAGSAVGVRVEAPHPPENDLRMTEIFFSLQGEGVETGLPTVFLRLAGCSLRCSWCDTAYSFAEGAAATVADVVARAESFGIRRACVTGGEPLDQEAACVTLLEALLSRGWFVVLETSGGVSIEKASSLAPRERLLVSLDVKCPSSNMQGRNLVANYRHLKPHDQVKFVIADEADYAYAKEMLSRHAFAANVIFCPMSTPPPDAPGLRFLEKTHLSGNYMTLRDLSERVLSDRLDIRVGIQLHKLIWGMERGR